MNIFNRPDNQFKSIKIQNPVLGSDLQNINNELKLIEETEDDYTFKNEDGDIKFNAKTNLDFLIDGVSKLNIDETGFSMSEFNDPTQLLFNINSITKMKINSGGVYTNNLNPLSGDVINTTANTILSSSAAYLSLQNEDAVSLNVTGIEPNKYCTLQHNGMDKFKVNVSANYSYNPLYCTFPIYTNDINPRTGDLITSAANTLYSSHGSYFSIQNPNIVALNVDNTDTLKYCTLQHNGIDKFIVSGTTNTSINPLLANNINPRTGTALNTSALQFNSGGSELQIKNTYKVSILADDVNRIQCLNRTLATTGSGTVITEGLLCEDGIYFRTGFDTDLLGYNCSVLKNGTDALDLNGFSGVNICTGDDTRDVKFTVNNVGKQINYLADGFNKETYSEASGITLVESFIHPSKTFTRKYNYSAVDPFITENIGAQQMTSYSENGTIYWPRFFAINGEGALSIDSAGKIYIQTCDKRHKNSIEDITYGLPEILKLKPKKFYYNNHKTKLKQYGFIAQDVNEFMPDATPLSIVERKKKKVERFGFNMDVIVTGLVNSVKELNTKLNLSKLKNTTLDLKIQKIEKLKTIKSKLASASVQKNNKLRIEEFGKQYINQIDKLTLKIQTQELIITNLQNEFLNFKTSLKQNIKSIIDELI